MTRKRPPPPLEEGAPLEAHVLVDELWPLVQAQAKEPVAWLRQIIEAGLKAKPATKKGSDQVQTFFKGKKP